MEAIVWYDVARDGYDNMAIDEAMAHYAGTHGTLILRLYAWNQPFLSLGYFQRASHRLLNSLISELPYTRRLSGGGAIIHDREITYSLAIPDNTGSKSPASEVYSAVHAAIENCLLKSGCEVSTVGTSTVEATLPADDTAAPFLCFERRSNADLISGDFKVVGSAQRRIAGVILQHGSILLQASRHAPQLQGLEDLDTWPSRIRNVRMLNQSIGDNVQTALSKQFSIWHWLSMSESSTVASEVISASALHRENRYANPSWIDKR